MFESSRAHHPSPLMDPLQHIIVDRAAMDTRKLTDRVSDRQYWLSKTPAERFEALELLRQIAYGYDPVTERLQRVFEVTKLERRWVFTRGGTPSITTNTRAHPDIWIGVHGENPAKPDQMVRMGVPPLRLGGRLRNKRASGRLKDLADVQELS